MFGFFGNLFDMNHDGKLDSFEAACDFAAMVNVIDENSKERDYFGEAGLDYEELEMMDPEERDGILEAAGLDPFEFDF